VQAIWNRFFEDNPTWRAVATAVDAVSEEEDVDYTPIAEMLPLVDVRLSGH
jgi:hypothetical protein